jgi:hypothetical protein
MVGGGWWTRALAVGAKISANESEMIGESRRDIAPHPMCLRESVQQQDGRSIAAVLNRDVGASDVDDIKR